MTLPATRAYRRTQEFRRRIEGGWLNDPSDPGGATWAGVSLRAVVDVDMDADGRWDFDLDGDGDVDVDDMRALRHRPDLVEQFYFHSYWEPTKCGELPWPLCLATFDAAIHHGPRPAVRLLQMGLGLKLQDGIMGPATIAAALHSGIHALVPMLSARIDLMRRISEGRVKKYGTEEAWKFWKGWTNRVIDLAITASVPE